VHIIAAIMSARQQPQQQQQPSLDTSLGDRQRVVSETCASGR